MRVQRDAGILLAAALALGSCSRSDDVLATARKVYSQFDEELIIRHFFRDRRGGFFVDVGCSDPLKGSTTAYLEKHLGWSGIAIDALPEYAEKWQKERPRSRFFSYLVTDHSDTMDTFYRGIFPDLSSIEKDRVLSWKDETLPVLQEEMQVPSITLDRLLDENDVTEIDFLSMDIEMSEPQALAGFDIERFAPELVCIEAAPQIRESLLDYFGRHGYQRIDAYLKRDFVNWYFEPRG